MTIAEAIARADDICANTHDNKTKVKWLSTLESMVRMHLDKYEDAPGPFAGFDEATPAATPLMMPAPFDQAYIYWLQAQICFVNQEMAEYNNAILMFNGFFDRFKADYAQSHRPKGFGRFLF